MPSLFTKPQTRISVPNYVYPTKDLVNSFRERRNQARKTGPDTTTFNENPGLRSTSFLQVAGSGS